VRRLLIAATLLAAIAVSGVALADKAKVNVAGAEVGGRIEGFWEENVKGDWVRRGALSWSNPYLVQTSLGGVIDGVWAHEGYFYNHPMTETDKRFAFDLTFAVPCAVDTVMIATLGSEGISDNLRHARGVWVEAMADGLWKPVAGAPDAPVPTTGNDYVRLPLKISPPITTDRLRVWVLPRITKTSADAPRILCPRVHEIAVTGVPTRKLVSVGPTLQKRADGSEEMTLQGYWRFRPQAADDAEGNPPAGHWGNAYLPSAWNAATDAAQYFPAAGKPWEKGYSSATHMWFSKTVLIPHNWASKSVTLSFENLVTDAEVFMGSARVGQVTGPSATLDVTGLAKPGRLVPISLLVRAAEAATRAGITGKVALTAR